MDIVDTCCALSHFSSFGDFSVISYWATMLPFLRHVVLSDMSLGVGPLNVDTN